MNFDHFYTIFVMGMLCGMLVLAAIIEPALETLSTTDESKAFCNSRGLEYVKLSADNYPEYEIYCITENGEAQKFKAVLASNENGERFVELKQEQVKRR